MSSPLPGHSDPWRLADTGKRFSGVMKLSDLPRLAEALLESQGEVSFDLVFGRDERKRAQIEGHVESELVLECQRCLGKIIQPVMVDFNLAVIEVPEEAERLPDYYEPVQTEDGQISVSDIIEDELILTIPQVPRHDEGACQMSESASALLQDDLEATEEAATTDEQNPFAVLAQLKTDKD